MSTIAYWNPICTIAAPSGVILTCRINGCSWSSGCWAKSATFFAKGLHEWLKVLMSAIANWNPICAIAAPSRVIFTDWIDRCRRSSGRCKIRVKTLALMAISGVNIGSTAVSTIIVAFCIVVYVIAIFVSLPFRSCASRRSCGSSSCWSSRTCCTASLKG